MRVCYQRGLPRLVYYRKVMLMVIVMVLMMVIITLTTTTMMTTLTSKTTATTTMTLKKRFGLPCAEFSLNLPNGSIQSLSCNVRMSCVCAIAETRFLVDWRLLVKERIANIGIPQDIVGFLLF